MDIKVNFFTPAFYFIFYNAQSKHKNVGLQDVYA